MKDLKKLLFKSLAKQNIAQVSRWAMLNQIVNNFLKDDLKLNFSCGWKVEKGLYIIKSHNPWLSSLLFLNKKKLLDYINLKLKEMDLEQIEDIKIL